MKKECERTRGLLQSHLHGHVFMTNRRRIERHLADCAVCRSEFESLKRMEETRQLLRDLHAADDVLGRVKHGVSAIGRVRKLLYRPLWIIGLILAGGAAVYVGMMPRQLDLDIDRIQRSSPTSAPVPSVPAPAVAPSAKPAVASAPAASAQPVRQAAVEPPAHVEPLVVMITPENDKAAVRRINEVMRGHGKLRTMKFGDSAHEVSSSLTAKELLTFFGRIENVANIKFSRKQLDSYPAATSIPVVLKLKPALHGDDRPASTPIMKPTESTAQTATAAPSEVSAPSATIVH